MGKGGVKSCKADNLDSARVEGNVRLEGKHRVETDIVLISLVKARSANRGCGSQTSTSPLPHTRRARRCEPQSFFSTMMPVEWLTQSWIALAITLLIASILFKIFSASRSPLHALPGPKRASLLLGELQPSIYIFWSVHIILLFRKRRRSRCIFQHREKLPRGLD